MPKNQLGPETEVTRAWRSGILAPCVKSNVQITGNVPKVFLSEDQVFFHNVHPEQGDPYGFISPCQQFADSRDDLLYFGTFGDDGFIAIELGHECEITQINYWGRSGPVDVSLGRGLDDQNVRFTLDHGNNVAYPDAPAKGKVLVMKAEKGTTIPIIELWSKKPVPAMPNKTYDERKIEDHKHFYYLVQGQMAEIKTPTLAQRSLFSHHLVYVNESWIREGDLYRISPCIGSGDAHDYDAYLSDLKKNGATTVLAYKSEDVAYGVRMVKMLSARYGKNPSYKYNRAYDGIGIDSDYVWKNQQGLAKRQANRSGKDLCSGILFLPPSTPDMDAYATLQWEIYQSCRQGDMAMKVYSMPMPPDRTFFWYVYRKALSLGREIPFDVLTIRIVSAGQLATLKSFIDTVQLYLPYFEIFVYVDCEIRAEDYPFLIYSLGRGLRISGISFNSFDEMHTITKRPYDWMYRPNEKYEGFRDWLLDCEKHFVTEVQDLPGVARVRLSDKKAYYLKKDYYLRNNPGGPPVSFGGKPLEMPISL